MADDLAPVEHNIGVVYAYGADHADEIGTPWRDVSVTPSRVVIGFTAHVADHRAALNALADDPARLLVCQIRHSVAELNTVAAQVQAMQIEPAALRMVSVGADDAVTIELRADQLPLAKDLDERYGDLVAIHLGQLPYPEPGGDTAPSACPTLSDGPTEYQGLRATLSSPDPVRSGAESGGTVTITNGSDTALQITTGSPLTAVLTQPGSTQVVGVYDSMIAGVGFGPTIPPQQSITLPYLIGTTSCDPSVGYSLPPGIYDVHVEVLPDLQTGARPPLLVATPQQIEVSP